MVVAVFPYTSGLAGWTISNYLGWPAYERASGVPSLNTKVETVNKKTTNDDPEE